MVIVRCTKKLQQRLGVSFDTAPSSTTRLGDWYATVVTLERRPLVLFVSDKTLLPVLVPLGPSSSLVVRFVAALAQVLSALDVGANRSVLGTMNDFTRMLQISRKDALPEDALQLAEAPCGPIGMRRPNDETLALFRTPLE